MTDFISEFIQKKRLGQILVEHNLITEQQLMDSLAEQENTRDFIGEILVRKGFINEEVLYSTLAEQLKTRYYSSAEAKKALETSQIPDLEAQVSGFFLKQNKVFVMRVTDSSAEILTSDPLNLTLRDQLEMMLKRHIDFTVCSRSTAMALLDISRQKIRDSGKKIIEEALRSPVFQVTKLCDSCGEDMIFVLTDIARKHPDALARRIAIRRMGSFNNSTLLFVFQQLMKSDPNPENRQIIDEILKKFVK